MKVRKLETHEVRGPCHDCHNRARLEISFSHRVPIRLCIRCAGFMAVDVQDEIIFVKSGKRPEGSHNA